MPGLGVPPGSSTAGEDKEEEEEEFSFLDFMFAGTVRYIIMMICVYCYAYIL